jgi:uncharacterized protein YajQ (UPF0234 family)
MPSFDIVSKVDLQEVDNAVNQARKEINNRYDFRGSKCEIEYDKTESITLLASDEMKLKAMHTILNERLAARHISVRSLDYQTPEGASGGSQRQQVLIKQGITTEDCKKIVKAIKEGGLKKVQAQIQKDQVRVTGPKRDELQAAIALLKEKIELDLQFVNFKD